MRQLFEYVLELRESQQKFLNQSETEMERRKELEKTIELHGTCNEIESQEVINKENFLDVVIKYEDRIKEISNSYKASNNTFLHSNRFHCILLIYLNLILDRFKKVFEKTYNSFYRWPRSITATG